MMDAARPTHMFHLSVLKVGRSMASPEYLFVKRAMDIVLSLIALLITSPLFFGDIGCYQSNRRRTGIL